MLTLEQLRKLSPALNRFSDEELEQWHLKVRELAFLTVQWWIETEGGSKSTSEGFLSGEDDVE